MSITKRTTLFAGLQHPHPPHPQSVPFHFAVRSRHDFLMGSVTPLHTATGKGSPSHSFTHDFHRGRGQCVNTGFLASTFTPLAAITRCT